MSMILRLFAPRVLLLLFLCLGPALSAALAADAPASPQPVPLQSPDPGFITLCYHEVLLGPSDEIASDTVPVTLAELTDHFDWLRENGYTVVGVDDILTASRGGKPLPPQAVLLTFDDGYTNFYNVVFPLLKAYNYKAVFALQTTWLETSADQIVDYGGTATMPRAKFMTWAQAKEIADSGIVELASHSHDLHRGHLSSPQGIMQPAGASLAYDPATNTYETVEAYKERIKLDVTRSANRIQNNTGHRPRVMVWPYGRYTKVGEQAAREAGYVLAASLGIYADWPTLPRFLMREGLSLPEAMALMNDGLEPGSTQHSKRNFDVRYSGPFAPQFLTQRGADVNTDTDTSGEELDVPLHVYPLQRVMHVDIDTVYDSNPEQQYKNISALFDRIAAMDISVVYLQAYADPDGNGTTDALYFPSRHLPMRADLFSYLAWQIFTRLGVQVYAWMPVLGFEIPGLPLVEAVDASQKGSVYDRLTPFDPENRRIIKEIYEDLARHSTVAGVLFHDDAVLGDYEDVSPAGLAWLRSQGLPEDPLVIRNDPELMRRFSRAKSLALIDFTDELVAAMRRWSMPLYTARNMYARVVIEPDSEAWFGQNLDDFLTRYDYTGLMAMPYMEGAAGHANRWLRNLAQKVSLHPLGTRKTVFELQAVDWRAGHLGPVSSSILAEQMNILRTNGIGHYGYYPDDPVAGHPDVRTIYPYFSLRSNPYLLRPNPYIPMRDGRDARD